MDVFKVLPQSDYLSLNVPLWFLLTLFWIQTFSFVIFRLNRFLILILASLSIVFYEEIYTWPTPFMLNNAIAWFGYFAIGYLTGKPLIRYMNSLPRKILVFVTSLIILSGCIAFEYFELQDWHLLVGKTKLIVFIVCFMTFFSFLNGLKNLDLIRFYGKNSLIILGAHLWILIPLGRIAFRLFKEHNSIIGFTIAIITALLLIPVIIWMNKYIPSIVGKKNFKEKSNQ